MNKHTCSYTFCVYMCAKLLWTRMHWRSGMLRLNLCFTGAKLSLKDYFCFNDLCTVALPSVYEVQSSYCSHAWKAVASDLNEGLMCIGLHFLPLAQWSSNHQPNPKPEKPHPLPLGKVTGRNHSCKTQTRAVCFCLTTTNLGQKQVFFDVFVFANG